jgi:hypothetical protein
MTTDTLGDALPREQARVRDVLQMYHEAAMLCPQGNCNFAIAMIKNSLAEADKAVISGDLVRMIAAYNDLKEIEITT